MPTCPECGEQNLPLGEIECPICRCDLSHMVVTAEDQELPDPPAPLPADPEPPGEAVAPGPSDSPEGPPSDPNPQITPPLDSPKEEFLPSPPPQAVEPTTTCVRCGCGSEGPVCNVCKRSPEPTLVLEVEGYEPVLYRGRPVHRIPITTDELLIGRRDPNNGIYPEIDLSDFHQRGYVGRRHARLLREHGKHYVVDVAGKGTTEFAEKLGAEPVELPVDERRELKPGNRVVIGSAVAFRVLEGEGD